MVGGSNGVGDRSVLSDITNQSRKRGSLSMSSSSTGKDRSGYGEDSLKRAEEVLLKAKRLCVSQELGIVKESEENVAPGIAKQDAVSKNSYVSGTPKLLGNGLCRNDPKSSSVVIDENCKDDKDVLSIDVPGNIVEDIPSSKALTTRAIGDNCKGMNVDDTTTNKSLPLECNSLSLSSSSKDLELQKCIGLNDDAVEKFKAYKETLNTDISGVVVPDPSSETLTTHLIRNDVGGMNGDLNLNMSSSAECVKLSGSSSSKAFESDRCIGGNSNDGEKCENDDETLKLGIPRNILGNSPLDEELSDHVIGSDDEDMDGDDLISNKSSSVGFAGISGSSSSKGFEVERCMAFNGDGSSASSTGSDLLKACSCSFCLKAAHIWSDLHYQDTKGRLAVLKKSRKEVRTLVEKSCTLGDSAKTLKGSLNNSVKLESDLVGGWRSLFLHTEDILIRESAHLQSNLISLKELRARCKTNLEMISGDLQNKQ